VTVNAAPAVNFTTTESVSIDGAAHGCVDAHDAGGCRRRDYTPGAAQDAGTITTQTGATSLVPLTFSQSAYRAA